MDQKQQQLLALQNQLQQIKNQIELDNNIIKQLYMEKAKYDGTNTMRMYVNKLDNEVKKNFSNPDALYKDFSNKVISFEEFTQKFKELGEGKNYYYYKTLLEKLKTDNGL